MQMNKRERKNAAGLGVPVGIFFEKSCRLFMHSFKINILFRRRKNTAAIALSVNFICLAQLDGSLIAIIFFEIAWQVASFEKLLDLNTDLVDDLAVFLG